MNNPNKRIYLSPPHMSQNDWNYLKDAYDSNWIAPLGPYVNSFEKEFAAYHGVKDAAAMNSGTAALHLILRILGIGRGDTVFCSSFTFCASATPVVYLGAEPVFIDSETESWNMDPALLEEELKRCDKRRHLPKAVIVVHLYGQSADMNPILDVCSKYDIPVIEDAAEALGAKYKMKKTGTMGCASIFSFNGNKMITTSGGGMLISNNKDFIDKARFLSTQARDPEPHYEHSEIGYNYRMSNLLAALGRGQMEVLNERVEAARSVFEYYASKLSLLPGVQFMPEPEWSRSNRWLTCMLIDPEKFGCTREEVRIFLENNNIESRPLWKPMHMQPVFKHCRAVGGEVSEKFFRYGLCLPSGTAMTRDQLDTVCENIITIHEKNG